jgi:hypothetical protein
LVTALYVTPVVGFESSTFTPSITAPVESVTIPVMEATLWAFAVSPQKAINTMPATATSLRISFSSLGKR